MTNLKQMTLTVLAGAPSFFLAACSQFAGENSATNGSPASVLSVASTGISAELQSSSANMLVRVINGAGANLIESQAGDSNETLVFTPMNDGSFTIGSGSDSQFCLAVASSVGPMLMAGCDLNASNQRFTFTLNSDGTMTAKNVLDAGCLTMPLDHSSNQVSAKACDGTLSQKLLAVTGLFGNHPPTPTATPKPSPTPKPSATPVATPTATPVPTPATTTIDQVTPASLNAVAGESLSITYHFNAVALPQSDTVFVNFLNASGNLVFTDNHTPPTPTNRWSGDMSYTHSVLIPASAAAGIYRIVAGLYHANSSGYVDEILSRGAGVSVIGSNGNYLVGQLTVSVAAPLPTPTATPVSLAAPAGYSSSELILDDAFKTSALSSTWSPYVTTQPAGQQVGTSAAGRWGDWIGLPYPYSSLASPGQYDAEYFDPAQVATGSGLKLTAQQSALHSGFTWKSGFVSSYPNFGFTGGYFQIRMKQPDSSNGMWAGIWFLMNHSDGEIDLQEGGYNLNGAVNPNRVMASNFHPNGPQQVVDTGVDLSADYHVYGVEYKPGVSIKMYLDGVLKATYTSNIPTGTYWILMGLQVSQNNGDWHSLVSTATLSPSVLQISEVQVYRLP